jgi:hypothetical protein
VLTAIRSGAVVRKDGNAVLDVPADHHLGRRERLAGGDLNLH